MTIGIEHKWIIQLLNVDFFVQFFNVALLICIICINAKTTAEPWHCSFLFFFFNFLNTLNFTFTLQQKLMKKTWTQFLISGLTFLSEKKKKISSLYLFKRNLFLFGLLFVPGWCVLGFTWGFFFKTFKTLTQNQKVCPWY